MQRPFVASLLIMCAAAATSLPAVADDASGKKVAPTSSATKTKPSSASSGSIPARIASIIVASVVGIPISIARKAKPEVSTATKELAGDHKWVYPIVAPISVPGGLISAFFQGFVYGPYNAWKYCDQPFCAEEFSLGDVK